MKVWYFFLFFTFYSYGQTPKVLCEISYAPSSEKYSLLKQHQDELIHFINKQTSFLYSQRGTVSLEKFVSGGIDGQDLEILSGVPLNAKIVTVDEDMVFRHYTLNEKDDILHSKTLKAGPRPYILPEPHLKQQFNDLTGIFFTKTELDPHRLWLNYNFNTPHVDFKLPRGLKVLDLGDGVYLIPGSPGRPQWIHDLYNRYKQSGEIPTGMEELFKELDKKGGINATLEFPIEIIFP